MNPPKTCIRAPYVSQKAAGAREALRPLITAYCNGVQHTPGHTRVVVGIVHDLSLRSLPLVRPWCWNTWLAISS